MRRPNKNCPAKFELVKQLQGKVTVNVICSAAKISRSTYSRMSRSETYEQYREVLRLNNRKKPSLVLKPVETTVEPTKAFKTNDITQLGEISTLSLLNSILGELKTLNNKIEMVSVTKKSLFGGRF